MTDKVEDITYFALSKGWFFNEVIMIPLLNRHTSNNLIESNIELVLEREWGDLWSTMLKAFPDRKTLLTEAKRCHEAGLYGAAIHLFYSQAEGLFSDKFNGLQLYRRKFNENKKKLTNECKDLIDENSMLEMIKNMKDGSLLKRYLNKIYLHNIQNASKKTTIVQNQDNKIAVLNIPSRHGVFHGVHKNYSSKTNSLKCFSFLVFIAFVIDRDRLHEAHET